MQLRRFSNPDAENTDATEVYEMQSACACRSIVVAVVVVAGVEGVVVLEL